MKLDYYDLKKMAKSFPYIDKILYSMENHDFAGKKYKDKLKKCGVYKNRSRYLKTKKYILIYKAAFFHSLECMRKEDSKIVKEVYINKKSVYSVAMENYLSESGVYRILKKFLLLFFWELMKTPRIIHPILLILS